MSIFSHIYLEVHMQNNKWLEVKCNDGLFDKTPDGLFNKDPLPESKANSDFEMTKTKN